MKAIDLINAMLYDSNLAEFGQIWRPDEDLDIKGYFGDFHITEGEILPGESYFNVWSANFNDIYPFDIHNRPDAILERDQTYKFSADDRYIYLWRIE